MKRRYYIVLSLLFLLVFGCQSSSDNDIVVSSPSLSQPTSSGSVAGKSSQSEPDDSVERKRLANEIRKYMIFHPKLRRGMNDVTKVYTKVKCEPIEDRRAKRACKLQFGKPGAMLSTMTLAHLEVLDGLLRNHQENGVGDFIDLFQEMSDDEQEVFIENGDALMAQLSPLIADVTKVTSNIPDASQKTLVRLITSMLQDERFDYVMQYIVSRSDTDVELQGEFLNAAIVFANELSSQESDSEVSLFDEVMAIDFPDDIKFSLPNDELLVEASTHLTGIASTLSDGGFGRLISSLKEFREPINGSTFYIVNNYWEPVIESVVLSYAWFTPFARKSFVNANMAKRDLFYDALFHWNMARTQRYEQLGLEADLDDLDDLLVPALFPLIESGILEDTLNLTAVAVLTYGDTHDDENLSKIQEIIKPLYHPDTMIASRVSDAFLGFVDHHSDKAETLVLGGLSIVNTMLKYDGASEVVALLKSTQTLFAPSDIDKNAFVSNKQVLSMLVSKLRNMDGVRVSKALTEVSKLLKNHRDKAQQMLVRFLNSDAVPSLMTLNQPVSH